MGIDGQNLKMGQERLSTQSKAIDELRAKPLPRKRFVDWWSWNMVSIFFSSSYCDVGMPKKKEVISKGCATSFFFFKAEVMAWNNSEDPPNCVDIKL